MERRKALVIAGTVTASLAMAGGALAANMGLLGSAGADVGKLDANNVSQLQSPDTTATGPDVTVIVQDVPVPATGGTGSGVSAGSGSNSSVGSTSGSAPAVVSPPSGGYVDDDDDHGEDDDHDEYEDHDEDEDHDSHDDHDEDDD